MIFASCSGDWCKSDPPQTCCCHCLSGVSGFSLSSESGYASKAAILSTTDQRGGRQCAGAVCRPPRGAMTGRTTTRNHPRLRPRSSCKRGVGDDAPLHCAGVAPARLVVVVVVVVIRGR